MTTLHLIDAFTAEPFKGNPAAVCVLSKAAPEEWMRLVAREMNLSETAFVHAVEGGFSLRWFTPRQEVRLCGHATLASAFALWEAGILSGEEAARFHTLSGGLTCTRAGGWITMDFPARPCVACEPPAGLAAALGTRLLYCGNNGMDYLVEVPDEVALRNLQPDMAALRVLPVRGVIATCRSSLVEFDFVSRFFAPGAGIDEDPVTGSAHCALGPHWEARLHKKAFTAFQASARGGVVKVETQGDRVHLGGQAVAMGRVELFHAPDQSGARPGC